jgi:hypothetical protein
MKDDPIRYCRLYKEGGCSHVDGYLCDLQTCSIRIDYEQKIETHQYDASAEEE